jgi:hypothetical protein
MDLKRTWACILDLAKGINDQGSEAREEELLALARLVLDFHRDVVRNPLRARADETSRDGTTGIATASPRD